MADIEVNRLVKEYEYYEKGQGLKGSVANIFKRKKLIRKAVNGISFEINEAGVIGFLGPNGAGKTTTMKMLSGILFPTSGTANVNGFVPWERKKDFKMNMSIVMGQKTQLNWDLPATDSFYLASRIYELEESIYKKNMNELVDVLHAEKQLNVQVRRLSLGERMKMELIAALIHKPKIVFLDEPTIGLDFVSQQSIREFIKYYCEQNQATVILTSHYMKDIEALCKRAIIISDGNLVYDGDLHKINDIFGKHKVIRLQFERPVLQEEMNQYGRITEYREDTMTVKLEVEQKDLRDCAKKLLSTLPVQDLIIEDTEIEDAIARLYKMNGVELEKNG